jgi:hypothetical protein
LPVLVFEARRGDVAERSDWREKRRYLLAAMFEERPARIADQQKAHCQSLNSSATALAMIAVDNIIGSYRRQRLVANGA